MESAADITTKESSYRQQLPASPYVDRSKHNLSFFRNVSSDLSNYYVLQVAWNNTYDCDNALAKFAYVQPFCPITEFVTIILRGSDTRIPPNPTPLADSVAVWVPLAVRPHFGPYVGYWAPGAPIGAVQW